MCVWRTAIRLARRGAGRDLHPRHVVSGRAVVDACRSTGAPRRRHPFEGLDKRIAANWLARSPPGAAGRGHRNDPATTTSSPRFTGCRGRWGGDGLGPLECAAGASPRTRSPPSERIPSRAPPNRAWRSANNRSSTRPTGWWPIPKPGRRTGLDGGADPDRIDVDVCPAPTSTVTGGFDAQGAGRTRARPGERVCLLSSAIQPLKAPDVCCWRGGSADSPFAATRFGCAAAAVLIVGGPSGTGLERLWTLIEQATNLASPTPSRSCRQPSDRLADVYRASDLFAIYQLFRLRDGWPSKAQAWNAGDRDPRRQTRSGRRRRAQWSARRRA